SFASGSTRFFSASPCQVSAISAPAAWQAFAMPQAMERLLAMPSTIPRLPCISPEILAIAVHQAQGGLGTPALPSGTALNRYPMRTNLNRRNRLADWVLCSTSDCTDKTTEQSFHERVSSEC